MQDKIKFKTNRLLFCAIDFVLYCVYIIRSFFKHLFIEYHVVCGSIYTNVCNVKMISINIQRKIH